MFELSPEQMTELDGFVEQWEREGVSEDDIKTAVQNYINEKEQEASIPESTDGNFQEGTPEDAAVVPTDTTESASEDSSSATYGQENLGKINRIVEESNTLDEGEQKLANDNAIETKIGFYNSLNGRSDSEIRVILGSESAYQEYLRFKQTGQVNISDMELQEASDPIRQRKLREYTEDFTEEERVQIEQALEERVADNNKENEIFIKNYETTEAEFKASEETFHTVEAEVKGYIERGEDIPDELKKRYKEAKEQYIRIGQKAESMYDEYLELSRNSLSEAQVLDAFSRTHSVPFRAKLRGKELLNNVDRIGIEIGQWLDKNILEGTSYDLPDAEEKLEERQKENVEEDRELAEIRDKKLWAPLKVKDINNFGDFSEFFWTGLADNWTSVATMALRLVPYVGTPLANALLFSDVAGGKVGDIELQKFHATENIPKLLDYRNNTDLTDAQKDEIDAAINDLRNSEQITNIEKWNAAGLHAGAEVLFESLLGFGRIFDRFGSTWLKLKPKTRMRFKTKIGDRIRQRIKFSSPKIKKVGGVLRVPARGFLEEGAEEIATQISQNSVDVLYLGEDKSILEGVPEAALQGGLIGAALNTSLNSAGYIGSTLMTEIDRERNRPRANRVKSMIDELRTNDNLTESQINDLQNDIKTELKEYAWLYDEMVSGIGYMTTEELVDVFQDASKLTSISKQIQNLNKSTTLSENARNAQLARRTAEALVVRKRMDNILRSEPTLEEQAFLDGDTTFGAEVNAETLRDKFQRRKDRLDNAFKYAPDSMKEELRKEIKTVEGRIAKVDKIVADREQAEREQEATQTETQTKEEAPAPRTAEKTEGAEVSEETSELGKKFSEALDEKPAKRSLLKKEATDRFKIKNKAKKAKIPKYSSKAKATGNIKGYTFNKDLNEAQIDPNVGVGDEVIDATIKEINKNLKGKVSFIAVDSTDYTAQASMVDVGDGQSRHVIRIDRKNLSREALKHEEAHIKRGLLFGSNRELYREVDRAFRGTLEDKATQEWIRSKYKNEGLTKAGSIDEQIAFVLGKIADGDTEFIDEFKKQFKNPQEGTSLIQRIIAFFRRLFGLDKSSDAFNEAWAKAEKFLGTRDFTQAETQEFWAAYLDHVLQPEKEFHEALQTPLNRKKDDDKQLAADQIKSIFENMELLTMFGENGTIDRRVFANDKLYWYRSGNDAYKLMKNLYNILQDAEYLFRDSDIGDLREFVANEFIKQNRVELERINYKGVEKGTEGFTQTGIKAYKQEAGKFIDVLLNVGARKVNFSNALIKASGEIASQDKFDAKLYGKRKEVLEFLVKRDKKLVVPNLAKEYKAQILKRFDETGGEITQELKDWKKIYQDLSSGKYQTPDMIVSDLSIADINILRELVKNKDYENMFGSELIALAKAKNAAKSAEREFADGLLRMAGDNRAGTHGRTFAKVPLKKLGEMFIRGISIATKSNEPTHAMVLMPAIQYVIRQHPKLQKHNELFIMSEFNKLPQDERQSIVNEVFSFVQRKYDFFTRDILGLESNPFQKPGEQNNIVVLLNPHRAQALAQSAMQLESSYLPNEVKPGSWTKSGFYRDGDPYLINSNTQLAIDLNDPLDNPEPMITTQMQEDVPIYVDSERAAWGINYMRNGKHREFTEYKSKGKAAIADLNVQIFEIEKQIQQGVDIHKNTRKLESLKLELRQEELKIEAKERALFDPMLTLANIGSVEDKAKPSYIKHGRYLPGRHHTYGTIASFQASKQPQFALGFVSDSQFELPEINARTIEDVKLDLALTYAGKEIYGETPEEVKEKALTWFEMNKDAIKQAFIDPVNSDLMNNANEVVHFGRAVYNYGSIFQLKPGETLYKDANGNPRRLSLPYEIDEIASGITNAAKVTWDHNAMEWGNLLGGGRDAYPELAKAMRDISQSLFGSDVIDASPTAVRQAIMEFYDLTVYRDKVDEEDALDNDEKKIVEWHSLQQKAAQVDKGYYEWKAGEEKKFKDYRNKVNNLDKDLNNFAGIKYTKNGMEVAPPAKMQMVINAYLTSPHFEDTMRAIFKNPFMTILYAIGDSTLGSQLGDAISSEFSAMTEKESAEFQQLSTILTTGGKLNPEQLERFKELRALNALQKVVGTEQFGKNIALAVRDAFKKKLPTLYKYIEVVQELVEFHADEYPDDHIVITDPIDNFKNVHEKWLPEVYRNLQGYDTSKGNKGNQVKLSLQLGGTQRNFNKEKIAIASAIIHGADKAVVSGMIRYLHPKGVFFKINHDGFTGQSGQRQEMIDAYIYATKLVYDSDYLWSVFRDNLPNHPEKAKELYEKIIPEDFKKVPVEDLNPEGTGYGQGVKGTSKVKAFDKREREFGRQRTSDKDLAFYKAERIDDACKT